MTQILVFALSAAIAAGVLLFALARAFEKRPLSRDDTGTSGEAIVFLIRDEKLVDANFAAHKYLDAFHQDGQPIAAIRRAVHSMFEDAEDLLRRGADGVRVTAISRDGAMQAIAETLGQTVRLKISSRLAAASSGEDIHRLAAQEAELETLRETTDSAPYLVWRETPDGTPIWVNRAYVETVRDVHGDERATHWPLPRLFNGVGLGASQRKSLTLPSQGGTRWYECYGVSIGKDRLFTAFDADTIVRAETQLREFMQTLAKTFAELTVGLAIFDRRRHLRLFNPALSELTTVQPEFLANRPKLAEFLDRLRESRMMPEPKNYKEWRRRISELEEGAENGSYSETWSLPGNLTYRVTGRPHPDGAIAFLFEDISAEISLTRQFRRELEISQALLDNMDDATAHFSRTGGFLQANRAYRELWDAEFGNLETEETVLEEIDVIRAGRVWLAASEPTPVWGDVREFVLDGGERTEWDARVRLLNGKDLDCRFVPMPGGGSQLIFRMFGSRARRKSRHLELVQ